MKPPYDNYTYGTRKPDPKTGLINVADRDVETLIKAGWVSMETTAKAQSKKRRVALTDTPKEVGEG